MLALFLRMSLLAVASLVCSLVKVAASLSLPPLTRPRTALSTRACSSLTPPGRVWLPVLVRSCRALL